MLACLYSSLSDGSHRLAFHHSCAHSYLAVKGSGASPCHTVYKDLEVDIGAIQPESSCLLLPPRFPRSTTRRSLHLQLVLGLPMFVLTKAAAGSSTYSTSFSILGKFAASVRWRDADTCWLFSVQADVDIPQIAVIGAQSAGKSSLIESISGITLPRAAGTCTRYDQS